MEMETVSWPPRQWPPKGRWSKGDWFELKRRMYEPGLFITEAEARRIMEKDSVMQDDLAQLLEALGMPAVSMPNTPHEVMLMATGKARTIKHD